VYQEGGTTNKSVGVYISGNYCYTTNYQTTAPWTVRYLKIWDISNPSAPSLLTTYTLPAGTKPASVVVTGNYAYVTDLNTNTIQVVDTTNPLAPNYLASMQASALFNVINDASFNNVSLTGNYCYITSGQNATYGGAIDFYDITNKSSPVKVSTFQESIPSSVFGAGCVYNNLIFVADYGVAPGTASSLKIYSTMTALSNPISCKWLQSASAQISNVGASATGIAILQASDDAHGAFNSWSDISSTATTVNGTAICLVPKFDISYEYLTLAYTSTGTGGFHFSLMGFG
jgi:hypothetical protein